MLRGVGRLIHPDRRKLSCIPTNPSATLRLVGLPSGPSHICTMSSIAGTLEEPLPKRAKTEEKVDSLT